MSYGTALTLGGPGLVTSSQASLSSKASYHTPSSQLGSRCCETGRPIIADPSTGQTICSCQMKTGSHAYLSRVPSLPESIYGSATSPVFQTTALLGTEPSAFYPMASLPTDRLPEGLKAAAPGGHNPYYIDGLLTTNPYNSFYPGLDLNSAARRKNATRETTSALKAWLYEHRKNPYPTKGEKIMLAIITRMTLTQVSTWFANARRRLKKESKLNWNSKDDDILDGEGEDKESKDDSISGRFSSEEEDDILKVSSDLSDISDAEETTSTPPAARKCVQRLFSPDLRVDTHPDAPFALSNNTPLSDFKHNLPQAETSSNVRLRNNSSESESERSKDKNSATGTVSASGQAKPKIWSISEIIGSSPSSKTSKCATTTTSTDTGADVNSSFKSVMSDSSFTSPEKPALPQDSPLSPIRASFTSRN